MTGLAYNILKQPKELRPHPLNKEIYGNESADPDLVESIRAKGILETLVIRDDNVILSGHRRWLAAKALNLDKLPCRVLTFSDPLDEEEALIEFNRQREKTFSQKMKESDHLLVIERERAKARQGTRSDIVATLPQSDKAKSRDIVADKVGMSGRTFDKARTIWDKAKDGDEQAGKLIKEIDTGKKAVHTAFKEIKKDQDLQARREELARKSADAKETPPNVTILHGDFLTEYSKIGKETVDCIITDPPYVKEWLDNYEAFAVAAEYVLKPGGFLISYVGHIHLDQILAQMTPWLDFYWIACLKHAGTTKAVHSRSVTCSFKPILIFQKEPRKKPKRYFCDIIQGTGREKGAHEWQQGEEELRQIFEPFTDPGDTVLDPFMGSGTVISMGQKLGRAVIGFDIDRLNVEIVKGRVISNG
jgi:ParB-like chromosome segregation protein Spo0J